MAWGSRGVREGVMPWRCATAGLLVTAMEGVRAGSKVVVVLRVVVEEVVASPPTPLPPCGDLAPPNSKDALLLLLLLLPPPPPRHPPAKKEEEGAEGELGLARPLPPVRANLLSKGRGEGRGVGSV